MYSDKGGIVADRQTSNRCLASPTGLVTACAAMFCGVAVTSLALASSGEGSRVAERTGPASSECEPNWVATFDAGQLNGPVYAMTVFDDGSGPALYVGGAFTHAGDLEVNRIARWDGHSWSALDTGVVMNEESNNGYVSSLAVYDDGSGTGPGLYAGGWFSKAGGEASNFIARWDGPSGGWSPVHGGPQCCVVRTLVVHDDGSGNGESLYVGGWYFSFFIGGQEVNTIARYRGQSGGWSALSGTIDGFAPEVFALTSGSHQGEQSLYIGGYFDSAAGVPAANVVKWNGNLTVYSPLAGGVNDAVRSLAYIDESQPGGSALIAGGIFTSAGGAPANHIARWDVEQGEWSALGSGTNAAVHALALFAEDPDSKPMLYVGGSFTQAGGKVARYIARWDIDMQAWLPLGGEPNDAVKAFLPVVGEEGDPPSLYVGGDFTTSPAGDAWIANWQGCSGCKPADLNCDGIVDGADLGILLANWGDCDECDDCIADLNGDCKVDGADLGILLANWG